MTDGNYPLRGYMGAYTIEVFNSDTKVLFSRLLFLDFETITAEIEVCPTPDDGRATRYSIGRTADSTINTLVDYVYHLGTSIQLEG